MRRDNKSATIRKEARPGKVSKTEQSNTVEFVKSAFREYYFKSRVIEEPTKISMREFGYTLFGQRGMVRHLSFPNMGELAATLVREAPSDVFCSNAFYNFPERQMQEKEWQGASLIFDIDGKDLDLPCVSSHTFQCCVTCNSAEAGPDTNKAFSCKSCGGLKADFVSLPCQKCMDASKKETVKLERFLVEDFSIALRDIHKYFSGNNGFHVHVSDEEFATLDSPARSDLVGYIAGTGFIPESVGVRKGNAASSGFVKFPRGGIGSGWRRRVADKLKIDGSSTIRLSNIVSSLGGYAGFRAEVDQLVRADGARIDAQVTSDVHRIFRMPGTLNSKSGLAKTLCTDLNSFDPTTDACLLGDRLVAMRVKCPVKIRLKGRTYNVAKELAELPTHAAVYLACKGLAELA